MKQTKKMEREKWNNCIDLSVHHRLATLLTDTHTHTEEIRNTPRFDRENRESGS